MDDDNITVDDNKKYQGSISSKNDTIANQCIGNSLVNPIALQSSYPKTSVQYSQPNYSDFGNSTNVTSNSYNGYPISNQCFGNTLINPIAHQSPYPKTGVQNPYLNYSIMDNSTKVTSNISDPTSYQQASIQNDQGAVVSNFPSYLAANGTNRYYFLGQFIQNLVSKETQENLQYLQQ